MRNENDEGTYEVDGHVVVRRQVDVAVAREEEVDLALALELGSELLRGDLCYRRLVVSDLHVVVGVAFHLKISLKIIEFSQHAINSIAARN